ncbi:hypothetical protein TNCV_5066391 [Trichonephila clavipes]|nr:hypothetical protein TNCV_5066391 [Trichonephila clavipes]
MFMRNCEGFSSSKEKNTPLKYIFIEPWPGKEDGLVQQLHKLPYDAKGWTKSNDRFNVQQPFLTVGLQWDEDTNSQLNNESHEFSTMNIGLP